MTGTNKSARKKLCFVVCPIGSEGSEERKRSDQALKHIFAKALEPLGYAVIRADKIAEPGMITIQVLQRIMDADLVLADMTGHNANVFYELAVRHAVRKPIIHVIENGQRIPFDVADLRTIPISLDLDGAEKAVSDIQNQVTQIEAGSIGETPLKLAAMVQQLDSDPRDNILREILNASLATRADLRELSDRVDAPSRLYAALTGGGLAGIGPRTVPMSSLIDPVGPFEAGGAGQGNRSSERKSPRGFGSNPVTDKT